MQTLSFPWYDANWLRCKVLAEAFARRYYPNCLPDFLDALAPLQTRPDFQVQHMKGMLEAETIERVRGVVASLKPAELSLHEVKSFGRWIVHDHPVLTELQSGFSERVSELAGEPVEPSYNFLSLYTRLGRCSVHMDSPTAKWTLDVCLDQSEPWPIHFSQVRAWPDHFETAPDWEERIKSDPSNVFSSYTLEPGDALFFSGSSQWHYREPLPSPNARSYCHLLFFHFIPQGMNEVIRPLNWERLFGLNGLNDHLRKIRSDIDTVAVRG